MNTMLTVSSYPKSTPFMATCISTVSALISITDSRMFGDRHMMVVRFRYYAGVLPKRPNLHLIPYCSKSSPVGGGGAIGKRKVREKQRRA